MGSGIVMQSELELELEPSWNYSSIQNSEFTDTSCTCMSYDYT